MDPEVLQRIIAIIARKLGKKIMPDPKSAEDPQTNSFITDPEGLGLSEGLLDSLRTVAGSPSSLDTLSSEKQGHFLGRTLTPNARNKGKSFIRLSPRLDSRSRRLRDEIAIHEFGHRANEGEFQRGIDQIVDHQDPSETTGMIFPGESNALRFTKEFFDISGRGQFNTLFQQRLPQNENVKQKEQSELIRNMILLRLGRMKRKGKNE